MEELRKKSLEKLLRKFRKELQHKPLRFRLLLENLWEKSCKNLCRISREIQETMPKGIPQKLKQNLRNVEKISQRTPREILWEIFDKYLWRNYGKIFTNISWRNNKINTWSNIGKTSEREWEIMVGVQRRILKYTQEAIKNNIEWSSLWIHQKSW